MNCLLSAFKNTAKKSIRLVKPGYCFSLKTLDRLLLNFFSCVGATQSPNGRSTNQHVWPRSLPRMQAYATSRKVKVHFGRQ